MYPVITSDEVSQDKTPDDFLKAKEKEMEMKMRAQELDFGQKRAKFMELFKQKEGRSVKSSVDL